jgi:oligosaccharide repeat unit polymerase
MPSNLSRPAIIYAVVWLTVFALFLFSVLNDGIEVKIQTVLLILGSTLSFFVIEKLFKLNGTIKINGKKLCKQIQNQQENVYLRQIKALIFKIWSMGVVATIGVQGGFPLLWKMIGDSRGYADFGLPTINGGLVALYIVLTLLTFRQYLVTQEVRPLLQTLMLFLYCIAIMNRGLMVLIACNLAALYLLYRQVARKHVWQIIAIGIVIVYLLNFLAENRNAASKEDIRSYLENVSENIYEESILGDLNRGGTWLSLYSTAPLVNLNYNIDRIEPTYVPDYVLRALFPSVVRDYIFQNSQKEYEMRYSLEMVNKAFNTFTFFANYLRDFGLWGCVGISLLVQLVANRFYKMAIRGDEGSKIAYCGIYAAVVLSPFTDFFGTLIIPTQIYIGVAITRGLSKRLKTNARLVKV